MDKTKLTFGERACGVSFNPGGNTDVNNIKTKFAEIVDLLQDYRNKCTDGDEARMLYLAITEVQTAQMWAVKAVTWNL